MVHCHPENRFAYSGVPQVSVFGPLLFALYINELPSLELLMFVDDIKLYCTIHSQEDCLILQNDIDVLRRLQV